MKVVPSKTGRFFLRGLSPSFNLAGSDLERYHGAGNHYTNISETTGAV